MSKPIKEATYLAATLGPGGRGGGPRKLQRILLYAIIIETSLILLLELNYSASNQIANQSRANG